MWIPSHSTWNQWGSEKYSVFSGVLSVPCDENGNYLPEGTPAPPRTQKKCDDWTPFDSELQFKVADFLYHREEMSQGNINYLLELWGLLLMKHGSSGPFESYKHIYDTIDAIEEGDAPWQCFKTSIDEIEKDAPNWKQQEYEIWYRDPEVVFDAAPYVESVKTDKDDKDGKQRWADFMSANYAWCHSDPVNNDGAMYVPIILGSDKTTVSVGTGDIEYHPLYLSIGTVHNSVHCAHRNAVVLIGFLAIPKDDCKYDNDLNFCRFKRQLYHSSISAILSTLRPAMKTPAVYRCPDGHFRHIIFDLGPFIADYPEQVMLAGILQNWCPRCTSLPTDIDSSGGPRTNMLTDTLIASFDTATLRDEYGIDPQIVPFTRDFPRADIHELISSDLLHQAIKGTFKDHLVTWVGEYLEAVYETAEANHIMDEIDRRLAAVPPFPELCRFKQGRCFKQWTGDDSKALMKIYLPAIHGLIPPEVVNAMLQSLDSALRQFHIYQEIFRVSGVRNGFSLPHQHSLRHITAVKKPWRCSSHFEALGQMLITNQRLDKLNAAQADYISRQMLPPKCQVPVVEDEDDDGGPTDERVLADVKLAQMKERKYPSELSSLAIHIREPRFPSLVHEFLCQQLDTSQDDASSFSADSDMSDDILEMISPISVFHSAVATFYALSDISGIHGMCRERIHSTPSWDCVFVVEDQEKPGFRGMSVVQVKLFFSFSYEGEEYPCVLVEWFKKVGRSPEEQTGMWVVKPEIDDRGNRLTSVVHIDTILRGAHLLPVFRKQLLPLRFRHIWSLDSFKSFFVNKYADHHVNEVAF
ncbi:hypothetical protein BDZ97DRAFT_1908047 [Flammula alnicola]|nr:hypothetical protein BDZ97DRAFT_1908047 [Flammula alnicola]